MVIKEKQLVVAGVVGLVCGKALSLAKDHPTTTKSLLSLTAVSAGIGATLGVGVAYYRKVPVHVYGFSVGVNFALCSFTFFGVRHMLIQVPLEKGVGSEGSGHLSSQQQKYLCSVSSGGVAGTLASIISRHGVGLVVGTGVGGMVVGLLGQWGYFKFHHWRKKKAVLLHYPQLAKPSQEWTLDAFQRWFLGFWHRRSKVTRVESEILLLETDIANERQRIATLDQELEVVTTTCTESNSGNDVT